MTLFRDIKLSAESADAGMRLDNALARHLPLSKRRIRRAIDEGGVYVNRRRCRKAGLSLKGSEALRLVMLEQEKLNPFEPEQLIWQQDHLYLIHKRSDQYAQEALHRSLGTLPAELADHLGLSGQQCKELRPVHRLDRGTSGLILFCDKPAMLQHLQKNWADCVGKDYLAVVEPAPTWQSKRICLPISRGPDTRGRYCINDAGRPSDTEAEVIERRENRALLRLIPHTGRTHQLRLHLAHLGCPILGDNRYGGASHPRLMLHAQGLCVHPPALPATCRWQAKTEGDWQW